MADGNGSKPESRNHDDAVVALPKGGSHPPSRYRRGELESRRIKAVVGIGASAGGLEALEAFLRNTPSDTGMSFVIVTHLHAKHVSLMPEILAKTTGMKVAQAIDRTKIEPNCVYLNSPGKNLGISGGRLQVRELTKEAGVHPIDHFFYSLAEDQKERAICIILSGTGTDGTMGMRAVKGEAGMVMAQATESAKYEGMPESAIRTSLVDYVLPAEKMGAALVTYVGGPFFRGKNLPNDKESKLGEAGKKILLFLRTRTGHDFSAYKMSTVMRRIERRMNVYQLKTTEEYLHYLIENPHESNLLLKELLISVTNFFRDPDAFASLCDNALPGLLKSRPADHVFRIWVLGCATGEEAYSLAISLSECMEKSKAHFPVQIFATDLDTEAIDFARTGRYPANIEADVDEKRLRRFFTKENGSYRIKKEIREMVIFAPQNVIKDPPFTKLDVISCRNLLIYFTVDLQRKLLPLFHYALRPGGVLFLGPSESICAQGELFAAVDKKWKLFKRKDDSVLTAPPTGFTTRSFEMKADEGEKYSSSGKARGADLAVIAERILIDRYAPASALINERGEIFYIHGRTGLYLEPAAGKQGRANIFEMAREGLRIELAAAVRKAASRDEEVVHERVRVKTNGEFTPVNVSVRKIRRPESVRGLLMVCFLQPREVSDDAGKKAPPVRTEQSDVEQLERELAYTKETLQSTVEELETSNEELRSANEELQSTNEELQSTNEEIETSKEEMQSLNEELQTLNQELQSKVEDLSQANDDMQNLLNSTDIATIFLENDLNIKRFTKQATSLIKLIESDVGRSIGDLVSTLHYDTLVEDAREVLRTLVFKEREVETKNGAWFLLRMMPYRTADNVIDGLVLTFVDITRLKRAEQLLEERLSETKAP